MAMNAELEDWAAAAEGLRPARGRPPSVAVAVCTFLVVMALIANDTNGERFQNEVSMMSPGVPSFPASYFKAKCRLDAFTIKPTKTLIIHCVFTQ